MYNFSDQCLDLARALLSNNIKHIIEDGTFVPSKDEHVRVDEPGHAALAIGEFFRATGETELDGFDLFDLTARCVTQQAFTNEAQDNGLAYAALGLLSFGASKERNSVWERLLDPTREQLDKCLLAGMIIKIISKRSASQSPLLDLVLDLLKRTILEKLSISL